MNTPEKTAVLSEGFKRLEELLDTQCSHYRRVEELVGQQKDALRVADVTPVQRQQRRAGTARRHLRLTTAGWSWSRPSPPNSASSSRTSRPSRTCSSTPPRRGRLVTIADELRRLITATRVASSVVRTAAESLARHMQGIVQSVEVGIGRTGIYGRTGRLVSALPRHTSINIRS